MLSDIFIARPRLAVVLSLLIVILGALSVSSIPVAQYPAIAPPTVQVYASYPGATAETVEQTVAQPLENALNGVPGMKYMQSSSNADGSYALTAAFEIGADIELAALSVQDQISTVIPRLPADVRRGGVTVTKASGDLLMAFALVSTDGSQDELFLSNYLKLNVLDRLARIQGVGSATVFGERDYAMRIWLDPARLDQLSLTMSDVVAAIETQNLQAAAGGIGVPPVPRGQQVEMRIATPARLASPDAFGDIVLRAGPSDGLIRLGDVARIELGAASEASVVRFAGEPAAGVGINRAPGANAVNVAKAVMAEIEALRPSLPEGTELRLVLNTADFVDRMIDTVLTTLLVAFALVAGVVLVFLGGLRATLIPLIAVPVSVIGAVAIVYALGFSGNAITLLALILAIGIVVDDAILVVENVERVLEENPDLGPEAAARQAMHEITPSIIGITMVLLAVLVPVAFLPGSSGVLFQQFAAVVAGAVLISALNALTLSPALAAALLRPGRPPLLLRATSAAVEGVGVVYGGVVRRLVWLAPLGLALALAAGWGSYQLFQTAPKGFLPAEDKGFLFVIMSLPAGASLERTDAVSRQAEAVLAADPAIDAAMTVLGVDYLAGGSSPSAGVFFVKLKDPEARTDPTLSSFATASRLNGELAAIPGASFIAANPPTVSGLGRVGGLDYVLEAQRGQSLAELQAAALGIAQAAQAEPAIAGVFGGGGSDAPRLSLEVDRVRAARLGVSLPDAFVTLQGMLGGIYVNDFDLYGRTWSVMVQAEGADRAEPSDVLALQVRADTGELVPIDSFATLSVETGPRAIKRYDNERATILTVNAAQGAGTGSVIEAMERVSAKSMPDGFGFEWTGQALEETEEAGKTTLFIGLALAVAYLFLVSLYESWGIPFAILLSVPVAVAGALGTILYVGMPVDIYTQIGVVVLIALAAKNAILIVSFALARRAEGMGLAEATAAGARLRFRPVMMTSVAFIAGLAPLAIATGPGAGAMRSVGTPVLGGMVAAAVIGIFVVPLLFVCLEWVREKLGRGGSGAAPDTGPASENAGSPTADPS